MQFIHQRKEHPHLLVVGQVKVPSEDRELLHRTMGEGFKQFIWDLKLSLLDKGWTSSSSARTTRTRTPGRCT